MPEIIIPGPTGRIEARYEEGTEPGAPVALILHHHPRAGGTMQDPVVITLYEMFAARGFAYKSQFSLIFCGGELCEMIRNFPKNL